MAGEDPFLRVERGAPDEVELAALVAALTAVAVAATPGRPTVSYWGDPAWRQAAWRVSSLPR
jgi:hypothetical protein